MSIGAIGLLVVNDHVLKYELGGAITGKVSDLAGLFFFPYLLAVALSPLGSALRLPAARVFGIAALLTALVFAAVKLDPGCNAALTSLVVAVLDVPARFVLDPTDVATLVALVPSWLLWRAVGRSAEVAPDRRMAIPAVVAAALATMATSPVRHEAGVVGVHVEEGRLFASVGSPSGVLESTDGGRTWDRSPRADSISRRTDSVMRRYERGMSWRMQLEDVVRRLEPSRMHGTVPPDRRREQSRLADSIATMRRIIDSLARLEERYRDSIGAMSAGYVVRSYGDSALPMLVRTDRRRGVAYRAAPGSMRVERRGDGDATWEVDWEIPEGRDEYLDRFLERGARWKSIGIVDMELAPTDDGTLVVALDGGGVLVRDREGEWSQHRVGAIVPVTPSSRSFGELFEALLYEWFVLLLGGIVAGVAIDARAWRRALELDVDGDVQGPGTARYVMLVLLAVIIGGLTAMTSPILGPTIALIAGLPAALVYMAILVGDWSDIAAIGDRAERIARRARRATLLALAAPTLVMILWALGAIVDYGVAVVIGLVCWLVTVVWGMREAT